MVTTISYPPPFESPLNRILRKCARFLSAIVDDPATDEAVLRQKYEEAVREHKSMIERICFGYSSSVAEMEDLCQDALLNLWESMPAFRQQCSMKTWVYRLTLNTCVSSLRKSSRKVTTVELSRLYDRADTDSEHESLLADLHEAIGELNPIDKAIMLLWLEEETYEDIAGITGVSKANVATRLHRAKSKLKTILNR